MANNTLGTIRGTIEIDYDGAGIVKAVRDTDKAKRSMDDLDKSVSGILSTFRKFAKTAALVGASSLATNGALQFIAGTLAVLAPLVTAGLAALPGILAGAAAAGIVAKVAFLGMGDALKAASGDAEAFEEAIKGLAPEAQKFARSWRASLLALKPVQQAIQNTFFSGLAPEIKRIANGLGSLRNAAVGVAQMFNLLAREGAGAIRDIQFEQMEAVLDGVKDFLREIHGSIGPVVKGFLDMAAQASAFGGALGERVGTAMFQFGQFLQRVDVAAVFQRALPILQSLGEFLRNVGTIVAQVFSVFQVDGANAAGVLGELAGKLADFLQSAEGQEALTALGQAMGAISGAAGEVFLELLRALAPIIIALAPGIAELAGQIADVLVPAIRTLSPLLESLAGFLSENMSWIGPLTLALVAGAAAYRTYTAAVAAWKAVETVAAALRLKSVAGWVANTAAIVANRVAIIAHGIATAATRVPILIATAAQWLWNASLYGFPLVWIIAAIIAVIAIVILLVKNWDDVVKFFGKAWEVLKDLFFRGLNYLKSLYTGIWNGIMAYIQFVIDFWMRVFTTLWNWFKNGWNQVIQFIRNLVQLWLRGLQTAALGIRDILLRVVQFFVNMRNAVAERIQALIQLIKDLPRRVLSGLGNIGRLLYQKGRDIIQGFINGIRDMIGRVRNAAQSVVNAVTDFLPGSPAKKGPLSGRGYALLRARRMMADLAKGIQDASGMPAIAMAGAVRPIAVAASAGGSGASTGSVITTTTHAGDINIEKIEVKGVLDPSDPTAARKIVGTLHDAIETYKKEYR